MDTVNRTARVRLLRSIARRPDRTEGAVCVMPVEEAEQLIAAALAEPVAEAETAPSAEPDPATPAVKPTKKPRAR